MNATHQGRALLVMIAATALVLAGCTSANTESAATATASSQTPATTEANSKSADLDRALAELVAMPGGPPGVISVVQVNGERTVHAVGVGDLTTGAAPTMYDHMRVASAAKAFSGATALALVDQGKLSLDDTIGKWLPEQPAAWAAVTLRQLLSHTSGLPDFSQAPAFGQAVVASLLDPPPPADLLKFVADQPLVFPPGSQYMYDNSDNITVGLMIEAATGKTYAEVLKEQVLQPLGLDSTSLPEGVEMSEPVLRGYSVEAPNPPEDETELVAAGWSWASGGVVSTPEDMNDFIRGYVGGRVFGPETQAKQTDLFIPGGESGPPGPGVNSSSMALFRYETPCGVVYGHTGNTSGYTQFMVASPDGTRSATVAMNAQRNAEGTPPELQVLHGLQQAEAAAICLALEGS
jgi:D-alanyl-D-alanine carboxypeptidase